MRPTRSPCRRLRDYDPARFELVRRYVKRHGEGKVNFSTLPVPNNKIDANNAIGSQFSIGLIGGAKEWAEADEAGPRGDPRSAQAIHARVHPFHENGSGLQPETTRRHRRLGAVRGRVRGIRPLPAPALCAREPPHEGHACDDPGGHPRQPREARSDHGRFVPDRLARLPPGGDQGRRGDQRGHHFSGAPDAGADRLPPSCAVSRDPPETHRMRQPAGAGGAVVHPRGDVLAAHRGDLDAHRPERGHRGGPGGGQRRGGAGSAVCHPQAPPRGAGAGADPAQGVPAGGKAHFRRDEPVARRRLALHHRCLESSGVLGRYDRPGQLGLHASVFDLRRCGLVSADLHAGSGLAGEIGAASFRRGLSRGGGFSERRKHRHPRRRLHPVRVRRDGQADFREAQ